MIAHLKKNGITDEQIVEMNFESYAFKNMNSDAFYEYVKELLFQIRKCTCSLMKCSVFRVGKMQSTHSVLILTATFM